MAETTQEESTQPMRRRFADESRTLLGDTRRRGEQRKRSARATRRSGLRAEDADRTEAALRVVYQVLLPRLSCDRTPGVLGYGRPAMAQMCVRNHEFFVAMATELGEWWERTVREAELASVSDWRRLEREHMEDAALDLLGAVRAMPLPVRDVVERRSSGMSWTSISAALPGRAYFSLTDDWSSAVRVVWERHSDTVRRLI